MEFDIFIKNGKGQASIEFMLLLIVMLLYIQLIIMPTIDISSNAADDVIKLGETRFAAEKLANTVDYIASSSAESKQTIKLFVPKDSRIECNSVENSVDFNVIIGGETIKCPEGVCNKSISLMEGITLNCGSQSAFEGPTMAIVEIWKDGFGVVYVQGT